jgi:hypothetical protein
LNLLTLLEYFVLYFNTKFFFFKYAELYNDIIIIYLPILSSDWLTAVV